MLAFLTIVSIIVYYADSVINSCSSWGSSRCTINCSGSPYCVSQTINCAADWDCRVQCYFVEPSSDRRLLEYSCSGSKYGCCNSIINCPAGYACEVDCTDGCSGVTINAADSSSLYIYDCNSDNNGVDNCQDMTIYCPRNGRGGATGTCEIQGDNNSDKLINIDIYTEEGLNDLTITTVKTDNVILHCGKSTTEFSCVLNTNGNNCASYEPITCVNFIIPTREPTPDPSSDPTGTPTSSTGQPSISPTRSPSPAPTDMPSTTPTKFPSGTPTADPTNHPTFTFNPTKAPTTGYPTVDPTVDPTEVPSIDPTVTPSRSPTPKPVRSAHVGDGDGGGIVGDGDGDEDTEISVDEANIRDGGKTDNDGFIMWIIIIASVLSVLFCCCLVYCAMVRKRKKEEKYGDEFRRVQSDMIYHTIPTGNEEGGGGGGKTNLIPPGPKRKAKVTITVTEVTGEHMQINETYGDAIVPLADEEEEFVVEDEEEANQRRLYYQGQFMQMMMADPQQQAYLMTLDPVARRQYIQYQCTLYLSRIDNMARRQTLPMKNGSYKETDDFIQEAPTSDEDSVDEINNTQPVHEVNEHLDDEVSDDEVNTNQGISTIGGIDKDDAGSDQSVDNINNKHNGNDEGTDSDIDDDILSGIETAQGVEPTDLQVDSLFD